LWALHSRRTTRGSCQRDCCVYRHIEAVSVSVLLATGTSAFFIVFEPRPRKPSPRYRLRWPLCARP
jgi:hypothetical protein